MKRAFFLCVIFSCLFSSCNDSDTIDDEAASRINSVSVIIDDLLWNGEIGDSIRNKFATPVVGLPQEEPMFTLTQYPVKLLEGYVANSRHIIVIKKGERNHFSITHNEFRTPQTVIRIYGKTSRDIINEIEAHSADIIDKIHKREIAEMQQVIRKTPQDVKLIEDKFKIKIDVPASYKYVLEKPQFLWLKREITSGSTSLLIYSVPFRSVTRDGNAVSDIMRIRDSIGKLYIHGNVPDTHMITEGSYAPYLATVSMCNRITIETKGTWELDRDFMSGPFINYCIFDQPGNRLVFIEGFCYAPSKEKRDLMLELEAIIKSTRFFKTKTN